MRFAILIVGASVPLVPYTFNLSLQSRLVYKTNATICEKMIRIFELAT